jgi:hypothetical protein
MADSFQVVGVPREANGEVADAAACLADEVAIDFPAISGLLDRIRRAFFGGEAAESCHSAEIRLTPREAFFGTDVPLDVPLSATCRACGGRGEVWMDPCGPCEGTGASVAQHHVRVTVPAGVRDGARFRFSVSLPSAPPTAVEVRIAIR